MKAEFSSTLRGLRGKLVLSHLAVILLATATASVLTLSLARTYFLESVECNLRAQAALVAQSLIPGARVGGAAAESNPAYNALQQQQIGNLSLQLGEEGQALSADSQAKIEGSNLSDLSQVSLQLSSILQSHIRVLDLRGVVIIDTSGEDLGSDLSGQPYLNQALEGKGHFQVERGEDGTWMLGWLPIWVSGEVVGVIYLGQPLQDVTAVLADLRGRLLLAAALTLPLAGLLGLSLAGRLSKPILALTQAAEQLSHGDFEHPLPTAGKDELGLLSRTFSTMRDRLQAVERMRARFVSDVSHELRTPLTAIKGLVETLREGAVDDPAVRDRFLASMETETDRLIRLVTDLLTLSRADTQGLSLGRERIDLGSMAASFVRKLGPHAEALGLRLRLHPAKAPLSVTGDPDRLEQVLMNLVDNALKHAPEGGEVHLCLHRTDLKSPAAPPERPLKCTPPAPHDEPPGEWAAIRVVDFGPGIASQDLPHLFERFYRADASRSRDRGGSGLGLPIAKAIVEAHGGLIWLESPATYLPAPPDAGPGATATVLLPLAAPE